MDLGACISRDKNEKCSGMFFALGDHSQRRRGIHPGDIKN